MTQLMLIVLIVVAILLYKRYAPLLLAQGRAGQIKMGLIVLGLIFLALALSGRAPAIFALLGAAMTQIMRIAPLLIRFAPSLRRYLGGAAAAGAAGAAGAGGRQTGGSRAGQSEVKTRWVHMRLDHASGDIDGTVQQGPLAGRHLADLSLDELRALHQACSQDEPEAARLVEAYVARERQTDWSNDTHPGGDGQTGGSSSGNGAGDDSTAGSSSNPGNDGSRGHAGGHQGPGRTRGAMSQTEACEILGVNDNYTRDEILKAHRLLIARLHPDKGGSHYLATQVNTARDILLQSL